VMKKTSGDANRRLQDCIEQDNGLLTCGFDDTPAPEGLVTAIYNCPVDFTSALDCGGCVIFTKVDEDTYPVCNSCTICSADTLAFDCTNLAEGECATVDCNGVCGRSDTGPTPSTSAPGPPPSAFAPGPPPSAFAPGPPPSAFAPGPIPSPFAPGPTPSRPSPSSASMSKLGILSLAATSIAAFGLF
jgi:hypothetical protein